MSKSTINLAMKSGCVTYRDFVAWLKSDYRDALNYRDALKLR